MAFPNGPRSGSTRTHNASNPPSIPAHKNARTQNSERDPEKPVPSRPAVSPPPTPPSASELTNRIRDAICVCRCLLCTYYVWSVPFHVLSSIFPPPNLHHRGPPQYRILLLAHCSLRARARSDLTGDPIAKCIRRWLPQPTYLATDEIWATGLPYRIYRTNPSNIDR